ncbi:MAG TPA: hypothetical protein VGM56_11710, partial [Byssovorax sp.]
MPEDEITDAPPAPVPTPGAAPAATKAAVLRVAVYDLELSGVEARVGRVVSDALVTEIRKRQHVSVVGMSE